MLKAYLAKVRREIKPAKDGMARLIEALRRPATKRRTAQAG
jgi:hypothetical protein